MKALKEVEEHRVKGRNMAAIYRALSGLLLAFLISCFYVRWELLSHALDMLPEELVHPFALNESTEACLQSPAIYPLRHQALSTRLDALFMEDVYRNQTFEILGGAIRIPTESFDDLLPVGQDPRWDIFETFHLYLQKTFPRVYASLFVQRVNTYGIVLRWQGSDEALKPVLLMAHQDVVPVESETLDQWTHPPFSGFYDGTWIWGRGSADDKSDLITQMRAVDTLLQNGFKPRRTLVLAYGFDEEATGEEGAGHLAVYLESKYGKNGFSFLVDEGEEYDETHGKGFFQVGIAEKGYFDLRIHLSMPGGHSSIPPKHTAIGLLSRTISRIEDHSYAPQFHRSSTCFATAQCALAYGTGYPSSLRNLAKKAYRDDRYIEKFKEALLDVDPSFESRMTTTQAADIIHGGVKVNALPESVYALVNHRIVEQSSVLEVQQHAIEVIKPLAKLYNLTLTAFGRVIIANDTSVGIITLSDAYDTALEPSPVTPIHASPPFELLSGTIKATLDVSPYYNLSGAVIVPVLGLGNTDTRFYWNLSQHIFRYTHRSARDLYNGLHTVNEAVRGESIIESVRFFTKLILNSDEADLI